MTPNITQQAIESLSPEKITLYLENKGWCQEQKIDGLASVWSLMKGGRRTSILLPLDKELGDFEIKIEELLLVLSQVEGRQTVEILKTLHL
ncbi:MAG: hypothetical protein HC768_19445 [Acaryochloris sp. CRU_2_0]|nr:hypothetical protein [Acaryochloris sp. CRU_2_0]